MKKLFVIPLLSLFLFASCSKAPEQIKQYSVFGREPVNDVEIFEERGGVPVSWMKKGYKNMTLVHIDAHDALAFLPEENIKSIKKLFKDKNWKELERSFASENYLYSAIRLGIARKIFWVIPNRFLEYYDAERRVKFFLKGLPSGFKVEEINKFKFNRGCVSGKLHDAEISICSAETLPFINEPVMLNIDVDFFAAYASEKGVSKLWALKEFLDSMSKRQMRVLSAVIVFEDRDELIRPFHRYVSYQIKDALRDPKIFQSPQPPDLWSVFDTVETMLNEKDFNGLIKYLREPLKKYKDEPSLILFNSIALSRAGREKEAFENLTELCKRKKEFCDGLVYVGNELKNMGKAAAAERFISMAAELEYK